MLTVLGTCFSCSLWEGVLFLESLCCHTKGFSSQNPGLPELGEMWQVYIRWISIFSATLARHIGEIWPTGDISPGIVAGPHELNQRGSSPSNANVGVRSYRIRGAILGMALGIASCGSLPKVVTCFKVG